MGKQMDPYEEDGLRLELVSELDVYNNLRAKKIECEGPSKNRDC